MTVSLTKRRRALIEEIDQIPEGRVAAAVGFILQVRRERTGQEPSFVMSEPGNVIEEFIAMLLIGSQIIPRCGSCGVST
jgi:hypothetical protein